ncbi:MAG TPA: oligosaccharide flippase family protein [Stellaceae bacterium]|nr:oligosaccharide flippase family protein [Stellaceae bacterium]
MANSSASIRERTLIGAGWMILWRIATRLLGFVSTLVLARVLVPADFGLVAIATTYISAFDAFSIFGLQDAIIRSPDYDRQMLDTAFTLSVLRGLLNTLVIAGTAPIAAHFFAEPRLVPLLLVLALFPALEGTENIGIVEFRRDFRFEREFRLFLVPRLVSVAFTIVTAILFHSYWVLVLGNLLLRLVRWVMTYWMHPYRPRWSFGAWRKLIGFSFWTWAATIADFGRDKSWMMVLGRFLDAFQVGVFMMAIDIGSLPLNEVVVPACRALFSGFTAARNEVGNFGYAFRRTISVIALPILPASIGMSAVAGYIVDLALGPQWTSSSMVIAWIGASSPLALLSIVGSTAMLVSGHVRNNFLIGAAYAVVGIVICAGAASFWGLWGVAVSRAALVAVEGVIYAAVTGHAVGVSIRDWVLNLWRPVVATAGMALALYLSGYGWITPTGTGSLAEAMRCGNAMALGAVVYTVALLLCWVASGCPEGAETFALDLVPLGLGARARKLLVKT